MVFSTTTTMLPSLLAKAVVCSCARLEVDAMRRAPGFTYERVEWWMMRGPRSVAVEIELDDGGCRG